MSGEGILLLCELRSLKMSTGTNTTLPLLLSDSLGLKRDLSIDVAIDPIFSSLDNAFRIFKDMDIECRMYMQSTYMKLNMYPVWSWNDDDIYNYIAAQNMLTALFTNRHITSDRGKKVQKNHSCKNRDGP